MLKYIIRLDDACPTMNKEKWDRVEEILKRNGVKPIVGIIPQNEDKEFSYPYISNFWENYAMKWQEQGWIIAQHGYKHLYHLFKNRNTEFEGVDSDCQEELLKNGYKVLKKHNINPVCFFAPNHTFDRNTLKVCEKLKYYKFISDGYAFYPYSDCNIIHFPSIYDTPHKICNFGVFTFIYHPNNMEEEDFIHLEKFIIKYKSNFAIELTDIIDKYKNRKRNILDFFVELLIKIFRKIRKNKV